MDLSALVRNAASTCVNIFHRDGSTPAAGVFVQGKHYPVVLSALHCFVHAREAHTGCLLQGSLLALDQAIELEVMAMDDRYDAIAFKVLTYVQGRNTAQIDVDPICTAVGKPYFMFGYSSYKSVDANTGAWQSIWRMTTGHFCTDMSPSMTVATTGGCAPGDSGGPVFSATTGYLVGINLSISRLHPGLKDEECIRMRTSPEANVVPAWFLLHVFGRDFLVPGGGPAYHLPVQTTDTVNTAQQNAVFHLPSPPHVFFCGPSGRPMDIDAFIKSLKLDEEALDPNKF